MRPASRKKYTTTGAVFAVLSNGVAAIVAGWLMTDPYNWFADVSFFTAAGALVLAAGLIGLMIVYFCVLLVFAVIGIVLERLGVKFTRPA